MAFKLAGVSTSTGGGGGGGGLSYEDFLNEWNWCWIAQGKFYSSLSNNNTVGEPRTIDSIINYSNFIIVLYCIVLLFEWLNCSQLGPRADKCRELQLSTALKQQLVFLSFMSLRVLQ